MKTEVRNQASIQVLTSDLWLLSSVLLSSLPSYQPSSRIRLALHGLLRHFIVL
jgi:hypothetical protein